MMVHAFKTLFLFGVLALVSGNVSFASGNENNTWNCREARPNRETYLTLRIVEDASTPSGFVAEVEEYFEGAPIPHKIAITSATTDASGVERFIANGFELAIEAAQENSLQVVYAAKLVARFNVRRYRKDMICSPL